MANNVVAYVGCDCFDIVLYLSRILQRLGKRVLIIDLSEYGSIRCSVPSFNGLESSSDIINYRKVDYTSKEIDIAAYEEYDDILISFGFKAPLDLSSCSHIICVSDLFKFNQERLSELCRRMVSSEKARKMLLIRNMIYSKKSGILCECLTEVFDSGSSSFLYYDERDYENSLFSLYGNFSFSKISKCLKTYLKKEILSLYPDTSIKRINKAIKKAGTRKA